MNGTVVNGLAIAVGSLIGMLLSNQFIKSRSERIISVLGLSVLVIGLQGVLTYQKLLSLIIALALGYLLGEWLNLEERIESLAKKVEKRFSRSQEGKFAQGFVTASLLFAVGAMAIVGSIESGLRGNETILYTKSLLDFMSSIIFASSYGLGVFFSSFVIVIYQGSLTLLSASIAPYLNEGLIRDISAIGSLLIMALGLNMMKATQFKIANLLPAIGVMVLLSLVGFSI
jgi:uncharacterized membrane protein YqgA involved in biofilm formation